MSKRKQQTMVVDGVKYTAPIDVDVTAVRGKPTETVELEAMGRFERAIVLQLIEAGASGPEACALLRAQVKQTAEVLSRALGVDRKTFYRWTKGGDQPMPPAVWIVLARIVIEEDEGRHDTLDLLLRSAERAA
jgi:DNA-binding transcriptional regulator YiaG